MMMPKFHYNNYRQNYCTTTVLLQFFVMKLVEWRMVSSKLNLDGGHFRNFWSFWFVRGIAHACHSLATRICFSALLFPI